MYIIKNALTNIWSSKGRNILIGVIVFVIAVSSCIALSVKESAKKAEEEGLKTLSVTGTISFDREKLRQSAQDGNGDFRDRMQSIAELTLDQMKTYAKSSYVQEFRYTLSSSINAADVDAVEEDSSSTEENTTNNNNPQFPGGRAGEILGGFTQGDFSIIGYSSYTAMAQFVSGSSKVTEGEIFDVDSSENQCIISTQLAAFNDLKVGDTLTLVNPSNEEQTFAFKITGLYTYTDSDSGGGMRFSTAMDPANQIYTTYNALNTMVTYTQNNATISTNDNGREQSTAMRAQTSGTYVFGSADNYNKFTEDVRTMGLSEDYTVSSTDLANYESSLIPIQNTAKFANTMLLIVLLIGGIILTVLNIFNIRERKYEVGVLTAIGMKKWRVAIQFVAELFIVTFFAIAIGTVVGAAASVPTANSLLESQITAQENTQQQQGNNFMPGGMQGRANGQSGGFSGLPGRFGQSTVQVDYVSSINASTNIIVVGQLMAIGILLTILASLSAVVFIMRYEPLKILSERV